MIIIIFIAVPPSVQSIDWENISGTKERNINNFLPVEQELSIEKNKFSYEYIHTRKSLNTQKIIVKLRNYGNYISELK